MTDFEYDVLQKKRTAAGAYHRKGGSKSKKCSLPSDNLTEAQKRKLNGPMTSVNLNQPLGWAEFKGLSDSMKKSYLMNLLNTYKPSGPMLGQMFGVSAKSATDELHRLGLPVGTRGGQPTKEKKAMWEAFCNGVVGGSNGVEPEANEQIEAENEQTEVVPEPAPSVVEDKEAPSPLRSLSAEYEGDAEMVYELMGRLAQMFYGDKVKVKLSIEVVE